MPISGIPTTTNFDIVASAGASRTVTRTISDAEGLPVTGWSGTDPLAVEVWQGDGRESLYDTGLSASWDSATDGRFAVTSDGTHDLEPKRYKWRLLATSSGVTYEVARGIYDIMDAPGDMATCTPGSVKPYTTIDDLRTVCAGIERIQSETDMAGLAEYQQAARQWFDDCVRAAYRNRSFHFLMNPPTPFGGRQYGPTEEMPTWLEDVLASGRGVKLTPQVRRVCALYACYLAFSAQMTSEDDKSTYRRKGAEFRMMAATDLAGLRCYVKSNANSATYDVLVTMNRTGRN